MKCRTVNLWLKNSLLSRPLPSATTFGSKLDICGHFLWAEADSYLVAVPQEFSLSLGASREVPPASSGFSEKPVAVSLTGFLCSGVQHLSQGTASA